MVKEKVHTKYIKKESTRAFGKNIISDSLLKIDTSSLNQLQGPIHNW